MRAAFFAIAGATVGSLSLSAPASALPLAGGVDGGRTIEKAAMVSRTVRRGPRCKVVVTRMRGPMGVKVVKRKTCL